MTYVISQPCVDLKDRACVDECPVDCIYEGKRMLYIHPDECVDCGACEPVCPVEAIFYEDDTPEQWKGYYDANVHFFDDLGSPGGCPTSRGTAWSSTASARPRTPTGSSTCRSVRRSTRRPPWCRRRCGPRPTHRATRSRSASPPSGRRPSTGWRVGTA